jgi:hypothetical protein
MDKAGLCVSAFWREEGVALTLRADDSHGILLQPGKEFAFACSTERYCIGWRHPISGDPFPCPDHAEVHGSSQCNACQTREVILPCHRCTGERCGNPVRRDACIQPLNHACYLEGLCSGLYKVGVAKVDRVYDRVAEQGARAAIIIAYADGKEIRNLEFHVRNRTDRPDRLALATKLQAWSTETQTEALYTELERAAVEIRSRLAGPWLKVPKRIKLPELPKIDYKPRLLKRFSGVVLRGTVLAVYGNAVIVASDAGEVVAFEGSSLVGYQLRPLEVGEVAENQMALAI